ncbi:MULTISPECIES: XTP/dITP diphosphatase [unclassified Candidatus Frackibacter]|uniref:XTP/dITP diphosphatase n=1 Tax=unclassified Candidatus Frackibacter TaxID=2648818 RepID=UPI0007961FE7|nr:MULTISPECIES: XTP/dITP diphosphatase [unclassified Candidatus Frackibacter]KXS43967.1 MAG: dITP/XTP pyrophosphatase [Candidatus Frackibacter sp. T328-2]SDC75732.1 XTP/dITP diphosphohydrolase [Candidatus Frackibacter sp. WG11]SEM89352.1 XTP/dITP diphosphohydrolase [Candidatus Frackibacter sp. WG12]SFL98821.1 XTP/dITP diphosphohydrolase [Candidatus Frackibacter sp. WG13]
MSKLYLATGNAGKIKEMKELLAGLDVEIVTADAYDSVPEVIEDGDTLEENAIKKARELADYTGLMTVADDTGLLVDALNGNPGIYSARYAGKDATYKDNNRKLLQKLKDVSLNERTARFKTVAALVNPDGKVKTVEGICEGLIGKELKGEEGFGYDPLFIPEGYEETFAQLSPEIKNEISHRAKALEKLKVLLVDWI